MSERKTKTELRDPQSAICNERTPISPSSQLSCSKASVPALDTIHQGDALEWLRSLPDKCVDIVVTSPPYNNITRWSGGGKHSCMKWLERKRACWYPEGWPETEYQEWQKRIIRECLRIARGSVFYNHKIRYGHRRVGRAIQPEEWIREFPLWAQIVWDRGGDKNGNCRRILVCHEFIYQLGRPHRWTGAHGYTSVWRIAPRAVMGHPCAFPVELARRCIEIATLPGDVVADPFMGSGSTALAAVKMNRHFIGCELNPDYAQLARARIGPFVASYPVHQKAKETA